MLAHRRGLLIASIDECISKVSLCHSSSLLTADTDGSIIRQVFDELDGVRQPESAWFAGLVTTLHEQNSVTRGQIMDQLAN